jgi:prophage regulatory protein
VDDRPLLLEVEEAARELGIGRTMAYQLVARREIPFVRIGRCVRIPHEELVAWLSSRVVEPIGLGSERDRP